MENKKIAEQLKRTLELLLIEKQEDLQQYNQKMKDSSPVERRKQGVCWYPVKMEKSGYNSGERLIVKISRFTEHKEAHLFQSGKLVNFFSNSQDGMEDDVVPGVINQVRKGEMIVTLHRDDIPEWFYGHKLGVQLLFDENAYREMEKAILFLLKTEEEQICRLQEIILGDKKPAFTDMTEVYSGVLNETQNKALNLVMQANDLAIVHGPPGTGKTTTLVQAILFALKNETQILVCAPSNAAVDLLAEKLNEQGVHVLRVGHPARVTEELLGLTLDAKIANHKNYKELRAVKRHADEYKQMGHKYKRNFGPAEREQRKMLLNEARKLRQEAEQLEYYMANDILNSSQVICSTLVGANNFALKGMKFHTVFIDEAAQGLEPATWIPMIKSERVIFAGDHCQLPPTIKSFEAGKEGLSVTLFEKAINNCEADVMLDEQYRMNKEIMGFSSKMFYFNDLKANDLVAKHRIFNEDLPFEFIDTAGCGFDEQTDGENKSSFNPEEVEIVKKHMIDYLHTVDASGKMDEVQGIGVISPYKAQVNLLQQKIIDEQALPEEVAQKININTVDSFQGQERDIIYISMVRSNDKGEIGFLADTRRMNVAITRARKKLVVIGDSATIGNHEFYSDFLDYANEVGGYRSAYEFLS